MCQKIKPALKTILVLIAHTFTALLIALDELLANILCNKTLQTQLFVVALLTIFCGSTVLLISLTHSMETTVNHSLGLK